MVTTITQGISSREPKYWGFGRAGQLSMFLVATGRSRTVGCLESGRSSGAAMIREHPTTGVRSSLHYASLTSATVSTHRCSDLAGLASHKYKGSPAGVCQPFSFCRAPAPVMCHLRRRMPALPRVRHRTRRTRCARSAPDRCDRASDLRALGLRVRYSVQRTSSQLRACAVPAAAPAACANVAPAITRAGSNSGNSGSRPSMRSATSGPMHGPIV